MMVLFGGSTPAFGHPYQILTLCGAALTSMTSHRFSSCSERVLLYQFYCLLQRSYTSTWVSRRPVIIILNLHIPTSVASQRLNKEEGKLWLCRLENLKADTKIFRYVYSDFIITLRTWSWRATYSNTVGAHFM